jgi:hypothetical protein
MTMTTSHDTVDDAAYAKAMKLWRRSLFGWWLPPEPKLLHEAVDAYFDGARDVLDIQRKFANSVLNATYHVSR